MSVKKMTAFCLLLVLLGGIITGCAPEKARVAFDRLHLTKRLKLQFATQFQVDYYEGGYKLISLKDGSRFLTVPENAAVPAGLDTSIVPLQQPIANIYLAATSAMCLFDSLNRLDAIRLSGTKPDGWYIENARKAMEDGRIVYAGKYSEPDYELLLTVICSL